MEVKKLWVFYETAPLQRSSTASVEQPYGVRIVVLIKGREYPETWWRQGFGTLVHSLSMYWCIHVYVCSHSFLLRCYTRPLRTTENGTMSPKVSKTTHILVNIHAGRGVCRLARCPHLRGSHMMTYNVHCMQNKRQFLWRCPDPQSWAHH